MTHPTNRRQWLKTAGIVLAGAPFLPSVLHARPTMYQAERALRHWQEGNWQLHSGPVKAKLNSNENPYGPSDATQKAFAEAAHRGNRYAFDTAAEFTAKLAAKEGVPQTYILPGNGSTDLLEKIGVVKFHEGGNIVSASPGYMSLIQTSRGLGADWKAVPLTKDYAHDLKAMEAAIDNETRLVYICNPNNPTGSVTDGKELEAFCKRVSSRVTVFVDEAYLEFLPENQQHSMAKLALTHDVIVARTFSKVYGMAGMRVGYLIAPPAYTDKIRSMFFTGIGLSHPALFAAMAALDDTAFVSDVREHTRRAREFTASLLSGLGLRFIPSVTSFVLFEPPATLKKPIWDTLKEEGILVRSFKVGEADWCRVSMGTVQEMALFAEALTRHVKAG